MKFFITQKIFACAGLLCLALATVSARNALADGAGAMEPASSMLLAPSITAHLQMQTGQIERLSRLFDAYAARRSQQESRMAQWQHQLTSIQTPREFDQDQAAWLRRSITEAQQQVGTDFLATRARALKILMPVQRAQLEPLATDTRIKVRHDKYYELLLLPVEQLWQSPLRSERDEHELERDEPASRPRQQRHPHDNGSGNYGVYGGYGQGEPQYGVYGSYGKGHTGVQVGIGRGGPSVGIGIGGIFGGWHRR